MYFIIFAKFDHNSQAWQLPFLDYDYRNVSVKALLIPEVSFPECKTVKLLNKFQAILISNGVQICWRFIIA